MRGCQEITELVERSKVSRSSIGERLAIRMHNSICKECRQYFKDSALIDKMLSSKRFRDMREYKFSSEEKEKIKAILRSNPDS